MKLHLPKALLTAILLIGACVSEADAATKYLITDSSSETSYTLTGGNKEYNGDDLLYDKTDGTITCDADIAASGYIWIGPGSGSSRQQSTQHSEVTLNGAISGESGYIQFNIYGNSVAYRLTNSTSTYSGNIQLGRGANEEGIVQLSLAGTGTAFQNAVFSNNADEQSVFCIESDVSIGGIKSNGTKSRITASSVDNVLTINNTENYTWKNAVGSGAYYAAGSTSTSDSTALSLAKTGSGTQTFEGSTNLHDVTVTEGSLVLNGTTTISGEISVAETATLSINKAITMNGSMTSGVITLSTLENLNTTGEIYEGSQIAGNGILTATYDVLTAESTQKAGLSIKYAGETYTTNDAGQIVAGDATLFEINSQSENISTVLEAGANKVKMAGSTGLVVDADGTLVSMNAASGTVTISGTKTLTMSGTVTADTLLVSTKMDLGSEAHTITNLTINEGGTVTASAVNKGFSSGAVNVNAGATLILKGKDGLGYGSTAGQSTDSVTLTGSENKLATLKLDTRYTIENLTLSLAGNTLVTWDTEASKGADSTNYDRAAIDFIAGKGFSISGTNNTSDVGIRLRGNMNLNIADGGELIQNGNIFDSGTQVQGKITKQGGGTLVLTGTGTYKGGTEITGGVIKTANAAALGTTGKVTLNGGNLHLQSDLGVKALELTNGKIILEDGATLSVTEALTLDASSISLATDIEFSSVAEQDLLVAAGGLTVTGVDSWNGGSHTIGGKTYNALMEQRDNTLWLTFELVGGGNDSITTTVMNASFAGGVLTLTIDRDITADGMTANITGFADGILEKIFDITKGDEDGMVGIELIDQNLETNFSIVGDGAANVGFYGAYYGAGNGAGNGQYYVQYIPEPASATLSLAALMMLAARRRRK